MVLDLLLARIDGFDGPPRVVEAPYRLVQRGSTAPRAHAAPTDRPASSPDHSPDLR